MMTAYYIFLALVAVLLVVLWATSDRTPKT